MSVKQVIETLIVYDESKKVLKRLFLCVASIRNNCLEFAEF